MQATHGAAKRAIRSSPKTTGSDMSMEYAQFTNDIPSVYDRGLGPVFFHDYSLSTGSVEQTADRGM
jgi:hypothetical protein